MPASFTRKEGQYLAFIYAYSTVHGYAPAENDMGTSPPSVHRITVELAKKELITRVPRQARSIELLIEPENLPIRRRPANRSEFL